MICEGISVPPVALLDFNFLTASFTSSSDIWLLNRIFSISSKLSISYDFTSSLTVAGTSYLAFSLYYYIQNLTLSSGLDDFDTYLGWFLLTTTVNTDSVYNTLYCKQNIHVY
jgi:hypothetical protein